MNSGKIQVCCRSEDIKDWALNIKGFLDDNIGVFGYFSKNYSGYPPGDVRMLLEHFKNASLYPLQNDW